MCFFYVRIRYQNKEVQKMTVEEFVFYFEKFIGNSVDFYADLFWSNFSQKGGV